MRTFTWSRFPIKFFCRFIPCLPLLWKVLTWSHAVDMCKFESSHKDKSRAHALGWFLQR